MERTRFWSRVGNWFTGADKATASAAGDGAAGIQPSEVSSPTDSQPDATPIAGESRSGTTSRLRASRSGPSSGGIEEQHPQLAESVERLERHLASQAEHTERIAGSLDRLGAGVVDLPEAARQQSELLSAIHQEASAQLACAKRIEESISQLPQTADAQRETMVSIGRQLDLSKEASDRVAAIIAEHHEVLGKLAEATTATTKALQEMRWDVSARDAQFSTLLTQHTKRFTLFAWSAIGLAVVAAIIGLLALFL